MNWLAMSPLASTWEEVEDLRLTYGRLPFGLKQVMTITPCDIVTNYIHFSPPLQ